MHFSIFFRAKRGGREILSNIYLFMLFAVFFFRFKQSYMIGDPVRLLEIQCTYIVLQIRFNVKIKHFSAIEIRTRLEICSHSHSLQILFQIIEHFFVNGGFNSLKYPFSRAATVGFCFKTTSLYCNQGVHQPGNMLLIMLFAVFLYEMNAPCGCNSKS